MDGPPCGKCILNCRSVYVGPIAFYSGPPIYVVCCKIQRVCFIFVAGVCAVTTPACHIGVGPSAPDHVVMNVVSYVRDFSSSKILFFFSLLALLPSISDVYFFVILMLLCALVCSWVAISSIIDANTGLARQGRGSRMGYA